jgi:hypothetical protein
MERLHRASRVNVGNDQGAKPEVVFDDEGSHDDDAFIACSPRAF